MHPPEGLAYHGSRVKWVLWSLDVVPRWRELQPMATRVLRKRQCGPSGRFACSW
jgi:hypothetical protein